MHFRISGLYALLLLCLTACVDPFDIEGEVEGSRLLVVDGLLTNGKGPYRVELSYSSPNLRSYEGSKVSGARVSISSEEGEEAILQEQEAGVYLSDSCDMQGKVGHTYQLQIVTAEGKRYVSQPETMQPVADIDSIFAVHESRTYLSPTLSEIEQWGMQVYVATGSKTPEARFYRWDWTEAYQISVPISVPGLPSICWVSGNSYRNIYLASSLGLSKDVIAEQPIVFLSKAGNKLQDRYSILLQQYSLSSQAYAYWEKIREQTSATGSMFDPPPAQIVGNMYNAAREEERVLGYFQVSAVTQQRFFIQRREVPNQPGGPVITFAECRDADTAPDYCSDCSRIFGATISPPSFW